MFRVLTTTVHVPVLASCGTSALLFGPLLPEPGNRAPMLARCPTKVAIRRGHDLVGFFPYRGLGLTAPGLNGGLSIGFGALLVTCFPFVLLCPFWPFAASGEVLAHHAGLAQLLAVPLVYFSWPCY